MCKIVAQPKISNWTVSIGYFQDRYFGDENLSIGNDGTKGMYAVNSEFVKYQSFELGLYYRVFDGSHLSGQVGSLFSQKRKRITNRLRDVVSPFTEDTGYSIDAYYLALSLRFDILPTDKLHFFFTLDPGLALKRFQRNDSMREPGIPKRFNDSWKHNFAVGPGVSMRLAEKVKFCLQARYYLRNMHNDYSDLDFRTLGWKAAVGIDLF